MENNKDASEPPREPLSEPSEPSEDPKDIARAMLIAGKPDEEVAKETGLPIRSVWGLKGAMAKAGQIPTRSELREREKKKPGPAEEEFREEREGVPFRRTRPAHVLIEGILNQFGVKERARDLIVLRARRAGGMHPSELERALSDLDTGLKKREVSYITEEYYLALQQEEDVSRDLDSRSYPMRRGESRRGETYPSGYGDRDYTPSGRERDYDYGRRPWEPQRRGYGEESLNMRSLMDILDRRDRDLERRRREDEDKQTVSELTQDIGVLATELRNLKENPPVVTPSGESDYEKTLKHTIERQDDRIGELIDRVTADRAEAKTDAKEQREYYEQILDKQETRFKEELEKRGRPYDSAGYKQDEFRLVGEGMHELADVMRGRGSPIKILVEGAGNLIQGTGKEAPDRARGSPSSVADLVGDDYVEK